MNLEERIKLFQCMLNREGLEVKSLIIRKLNRRWVAVNQDKTPGLNQI